MSESDTITFEQFKARFNLSEMSDKQIWEAAQNVLINGLPPVLWEPKGGEYFISGSGSIFNEDNGKQSKVFGTQRETQELAEKALDKMRRFNRLLAYVDEACGGYDYKDESDNYYVYFSLTNNNWCASFEYSSYSPTKVYMPKKVSEELVEKLNSGEVVL